METPNGPAQPAPTQRNTPFLSKILHDDLVAGVVQLLDVPALLSLQQCDQRLKRLAASDKVWRGLFTGRFGPPSKNQEVAHKLAGSWQALYKSKVVTDKAAGQWRKPCPYELQAALHTMLLAPASAAPADTGSGSAAASEGGDDSSPERQASVSSTATTNSSSPSPSLSSSGSSGSIDSGLMNNTGVNAVGKTQLSVIFMLDSSGSVGEEDFACMTEFLDTAAQAVANVDNCKVCVVQFSNETRVEVPLGPLDKPAFDAAVKAMVRLNGGTNIAAAVAKAGSLLKADEAGASGSMRRVLVLLTDGRIDGWQAREAASMVSRLADEQAHVSLWAFGVGRGVDSAELVRIIEGPGGACKGLGRDRYFDLCVRDDAPW